LVTAPVHSPWYISVFAKNNHRPLEPGGSFAYGLNGEINTLRGNISAACMPRVDARFELRGEEREKIRRFWWKTAAYSAIFDNALELLLIIRAASLDP
jgi:hypothetical protein